MRTPVLLAVLVFTLAPAAGAQPAFVAEASVDQAAYTYGEPITLTYTLRNDGTEVATVWTSSGCYPTLLFAPVYLSPEGACTLAEEPVTVAAGGAFVATWQLDPTKLGVPELDGEQTVAVYLGGPCGPGQPWHPDTHAATRAFTCDVGATATFTAPQFLGGLLTLEYALADVDSVASLKRAYHAVVTDSTTFGSNNDYVGETWRVAGIVLSDAVDALDENDVIERVSSDRHVSPDLQFFVATEAIPGALVLSPPAPNPTAGTATVALRLDRTEAVTVELLDPLGRRVAVLHDGPLAGGVEHPFVVEAGGLPAGVYVVRVTGASVRQSQRVVVAR